MRDSRAWQPRLGFLVVLIFNQCSFSINVSKLCGGGAKSPLWRKILAAVLNIELEIPKTEQGPAMGGAMLSMVAIGEYASVKDVCHRLCDTKEIIKPDKTLVDKYEIKYRKFRKIYPNCKSLFTEII